MVGDFVGAYFNTYYNAQKSFGEAEDEIWNQPELKQQGAGKNYLAQFNISQSSKAKFASVIEKCSKLLEYHPNSNLVDDALMMIGKSYFYQNDYQPAERKFKELISGYPQSGLLLEAKMLMAYCFYKEGDKASASSTAAELLETAKKDGDDNIVAYTSLLMGQMDLEDKNNSQALEHFRDAAESANSKEQRAFAFLNVAEMNNTLGDFEKAEAAYAAAASQSPNYLGEYKGKIGVARMLIKQKKFDDALELLHDLRSDTKYKEYFGEIELETGNLYRDEGNLTQAVEQYRYVDTAFARTEWSATSYYQLGMVYETRVGLYDSARVAYNKGRTEAPPTLALGPQLVRRADYMNKYASFTTEIRKMDSLYTYWLTKPDSLVVTADTSAQDTVRRKATAPLENKGVAKGDSGKTGQAAKPVAATPPLPLDSVVAHLASAKSELATLFYTSIGRTDSALFWYQRLIEDHPLSSLVPRALFSIAQIYSQDSTVARPVVDSLYRQLVDQYPQSAYAAEARRALGLQKVLVSPDTAETLYRRAEEAILAGRNDHAIDTLRLIAQTYPRSAYAPRAQYAAGWLYEQVLNQPDSAIANYQRLRARYPSSLYAARVQPKLMEVELKNKAAADSAAQKKKALADSIALKNKALTDSSALKNKSLTDSTTTKHDALTDTTSQTRVPVPGVPETKPGEEEIPINRRKQQEPPIGRDSTVVPRSGAVDTTNVGRKLPPIKNQE